MKTTKFFIVIPILAISIIYCFLVPKPKYVSANILPQLKIPYALEGWRGKDVAEELSLEDERYNFLSDVFARVYVNRYRQGLRFLILDAGNFHHPKVCFGSSGFKIKELSDTEFHISLPAGAGNHTFKAHTLFAENGAQSMLLIYWICIDKKMVDWTGQKVKQLWYSLFNKKRAGLILRLDIPAREDNIDDALILAKNFIKDLSRATPSEQAEYIFGKTE
jgi:EpsI family protein